MVLICPKCEARLQLDEAKAPSQPFKVRCPKCQTSVSVQLSETPSELDRASFERPPAAPLFKANAENADEAAANHPSSESMNDLARLLADALRHVETGSNRSHVKRSAWERRKALVCTSPAYREAIAHSLTDYDVFVAENVTQAL